jgi:hypothetical protein
MTELSFLDAREQELVGLVLDVAGAADGAALRAHLDWVGRLARLVVDCPVRAGYRLEAATETDFELHAPPRAVLGQAYLVAKIDLLRRMEALAADVPELRARARFELGQSIYSRLAEELFIAIVTDPGTPARARARGRALLERIWEHRLLDEIDDFAPDLEAAWEARNEVKPVLGTMLGSQELFRLFQRARDERFLDYFGGDDVAPEQTWAFEEFLFGLAHEEIARLRAHLAERRLPVVSPAEATRILGRDVDERGHGPEELYASYKRRKLKASYRALTGAPGPKHTAEEYVMLAFLGREITGAP